MFKRLLIKLKYPLSYYVKLSFLLVFTSLFISFPTYAKTVTLGTGEFPPYISSERPNGGVLSHIVTEAFAKFDYQSEVDFIPWKRALKLAQMGRIDATYAWSIKSDRQKDFLYSRPLFIFEQRAFALKQNQIDLSPNVMTSKINLCRPQGYAIQGHSKKLIEKDLANLFAPPDVATCFNMLKVGRVDIVVVDKLEGMSYAAKIFPNKGDVKVLDKIFYKYSNHLLISKKHPNAKKLMNDFNKGLSNLMASGEYKRILFNELGI